MLISKVDYAQSGPNQTDTHVFAQSHIYQKSTWPDWSRTSHKAKIDFMLNIAPSSALNQTLYGAGMDVVYYPRQRWATGMHFTVSQRRIDETFGQIVKDPELQLAEIGWLNTFDLVHRPGLLIGLSLTNGLCTARLGDAADQVYYQYYTRYGRSSGYRSRLVTTGNYYLMQPGISTSLRIGKMVWLTAKANCSFLFGGNQFAEPSQLAGCNVQVGISMFGPVGVKRR